MLYPVQRQLTMVAIAMWLGSVSTCQGIGPIPRIPSAQFIIPPLSANIAPKTSATATVEVMNGNNKTDRQKVRNLTLGEFSRTARSKAVANCGTEESKKILTVLKSEL